MVKNGGKSSELSTNDMKITELPRLVYVIKVTILIHRRGNGHGSNFTDMSVILRKFIHHDFFNTLYGSLRLTSISAMMSLQSKIIWLLHTLAPVTQLQNMLSCYMNAWLQ